MNAPVPRSRPVMRIALGALALVMVLPLAAQTPAPQERDPAAAVAKRAEERLRTLRKEADALAAQARTLLADLRRLELERQIAVEPLAKGARGGLGRQGHPA